MTPADSPPPRVTCTPDTRASADDANVSGSLPMSSATIASTIPSELRLIACADWRLRRRPVTTISSPPSVGLSWTDGCGAAGLAFWSDAVVGLGRSWPPALACVVLEVCAVAGATVAIAAAATDAQRRAFAFMSLSPLVSLVFHATWRHAKTIKPRNQSFCRTRVVDSSRGLVDPSIGPLELPRMRKKHRGKAAAYRRYAKRRNRRTGEERP